MPNDNSDNFQAFFPKASPADLNESFLIAKLSSKRRMEAWAATRLLRRCGTRQSVEALMECCLRPIQDLQVTSLFTLQTILGSEIADFAVSLLHNPQYKQKWAAMIVACESCGTSHRDVLVSRLKQTVSRQRACPDVGGLNGKTTEVLHFLQYLQRTHQKLGPVGVFLSNKMSLLTPGERTELTRFINLQQ